MLITFYHRKPNHGFHSIERVFEDVRTALPEGFETRVSTELFQSKGILNRFLNAVYALRDQSDINHVTGQNHYVAMFLKKSNTVLTIHDCEMLDRASGLRKFFLFFFWFWLPEKKAAIITVVSESTKAQLLRYLNCNPGKIKVIHNCVSKAFVPTAYTFNKEKPRILQLGTFEHKNLIRLAEALKGINCYLDIVGKLTDNQIAKLEEFRIDYGCQNDLSLEEVILRYKQSDIVTLISTCEGFGLPIVEANAIGRPVITGNTFSMPEVAGDAACLVDAFDVSSIRDGILRVIHDEKYRDRLVRNGFKNVQRFRSENIAAKYAEVYSELEHRTK